jgi:hypothetical protein
MKQIILPTIGDKVLRDGYEFSVTEVLPHKDIHIVASITLRGETGTIEVGYYDYLNMKKSQACKLVLQLMDSTEEPNYQDALNTALNQFPDTNKVELEKELSEYI